MGSLFSPDPIQRVRLLKTLSCRLPGYLSVIPGACRHPGGTFRLRMCHPGRQEGQRCYLQPQDSTTMSSYCLYTTLLAESMKRMLMGLSRVGTQQVGGVDSGSIEFIRV